jgi:hypothetical protein
MPPFFQEASVRVVMAIIELTAGILTIVFLVLGIRRYLDERKKGAK